MMVQKLGYLTLDIECNGVLLTGVPVKDARELRPRGSDPPVLRTGQLPCLLSGWLILLLKSANCMCMLLHVEQTGERT